LHRHRASEKVAGFTGPQRRDEREDNFLAEWWSFGRGKSRLPTTIYTLNPITV